MKYIKLFETHDPDYLDYINSDDVILPNLSYCEDEEKVHLNKIRNDIIIYHASSKLTETTDKWTDGLYVNAFNTTIKSHTFENGKGLIEFNDNLTLIGVNAFRGCTGLTTITIPNSVTTIGDDAFRECSGLTTITIPNSVSSIGARVFQNCTSLISAILPNSITTITEMLFSYCGLTSIGVIGSGASLEIPNSVTSFGDNVFDYCTNLTSVTIPNNITSIGFSGFYGCSSLISVTIEATTPPTLRNDNIFVNNATGRKILVPSASVEAYKSAQYWSTYASDIDAIQ